MSDEKPNDKADYSPLIAKIQDQCTIIKLELGEKKIRPRRSLDRLGMIRITIILRGRGRNSS